MIFPNWAGHTIYKRSGSNQHYDTEFYRNSPKLNPALPSQVLRHHTVRLRHPYHSEVPNSQSVEPIIEQCASSRSIYKLKWKTSKQGVSNGRVMMIKCILIVFCFFFILQLRGWWAGPASDMGYCNFQGRICHWAAKSSCSHDFILGKKQCHIIWLCDSFKYKRENLNRMVQKIDRVNLKIIGSKRI